MVTSKIEKAQGLILSISEATTTKGNSHVPSLLRPHKTAIPLLLNLKNKNVPITTNPNITIPKDFLIII